MHTEPLLQIARDRCVDRLRKPLEVVPVHPRFVKNRHRPLATVEPVPRLKPLEYVVQPLVLTNSTDEFMERHREFDTSNYYLRRILALSHHH